MSRVKRTVELLVTGSGVCWCGQECEIRCVDVTRGENCGTAGDRKRCLLVWTGM